MVKALDCTPRGPRFQPHYSNRYFFHLGVYSALPKKVSRCRLKVFLPEVYAASFGGDVKPLVPGYWLVLAISSYLVSHPTSGGVLSKWCGFSSSQGTLEEHVGHQRCGFSNSQDTLEEHVGHQ